MNTTMVSPEKSDLYLLREQDGVLILEISGEQGSLGWQSRNGVNVLAAVDQLRRPQLVIDLSTVSYGGSELIAFLFRLRRKLRASGGELVLVGAKGNLRSVLQVVRLDHVVRLYDSVQDAVNAINTESPL